QPLRLGGDGAEDQRALTGSGDTGEHGQPAFRDVDVDVPEVVLPRPPDADHVVTVCHGRRIPGTVGRGDAGGGVAHDCSPSKDLWLDRRRDDRQRTWRIRTML